MVNQKILRTIAVAIHTALAKMITAAAKMMTVIVNLEIDKKGV